jgi:glycosyltransferase involved in cell wall biosynthesis
MRATVERLVARNHYDAVVASEIHVARYVTHLTDLVRVLDGLEVAAIRDPRPAAGWLEQRRQWLTWVKQRRYARTIAESFDRCVVVSEAERAALRELAPNAEVVVVPNGVDLDRNPLATGGADPATVVHAGALGFWANREGVAWFADAVLPAVRAQHPDARLLVTGRTDAVPGALPAAPGVEYTGYLDDVRPTIARARASIVPLQRGGGTRLKILESLALGTPVVTTPKGVEGLDLVPDREVLVASSPAEFAASVLLLLDDDVKRAALREAGRRAVEERYGWAPIVASFGELVADAVDARRAPQLEPIAA